MKDAFVIAIVSACLFAGVSHHAKANASNEAMKKCLALYDYTPEKFLIFDFSKPAACHSDYRLGERAQQLAEMREFLKEHPWYKGRDWQWEDCAKDNTCTKRYSWWSTKEK